MRSRVGADFLTDFSYETGLKTTCSCIYAGDWFPSASSACLPDHTPMTERQTSRVQGRFLHRRAELDGGAGVESNVRYLQIPYVFRLLGLGVPLELKSPARRDNRSDVLQAYAVGIATTVRLKWLGRIPRPESRRGGSGTSGNWLRRRVRQNPGQIR